MKYIFFSLAFSLLALSAITAQNDTEASPNLSDLPTFDSLYPQRVLYEMFDIEVPPTFPGGDKELLKFLAENIKYPPLNRENNIVGSVTMSFIVESDGSISDKKVLKGIEIEKPLLDALDRMPHWSPGMKDGEPVAVRITLPIRCLKLE